MTKILVIEDEPNLRSSIMEILSLEGFDVIEAPDGGLGFELALKHHPDLIVSDITMPGVDGYQMLLQLRQNPAIALTPFIFLTARADRSFMRHGMELGADDYLTKPFTSSELVAAIQSRMNRQRSILEVTRDELTPIKQRLARVISHELKTPLTSIMLVQDLLSRQWWTMEQAQVAEMLDVLQVSSQRLGHLIEQIVIITQIDGGLLDTQQLEQNDTQAHLWSTINTAINRARRFAYRNGEAEITVIERDRDVMIRAHIPTLSHALAELITNAVEYSPDNTPIVISYWRTGKSVWMSILDGGPGIERELIDTVMQDFEQIDREKHEQQGLGLGLSLAQRVIKAHGGDLEISSEPGKGTQVVVRLPVCEGASLEEHLDYMPLTPGDN